MTRVSKSFPFIFQRYCPLDVEKLRLSVEVEDLLSVAKAKISGEIGRAYEREDFDALAFRGRIYIYSEIDPPQDVKDRLEEQTKHKSWKLTFRSYKFMDYLQRQSAPQAFISHDSRDKASIAAPLAASLQDKNCKIWFDQYSLKVGDSLRESIEKGLRECFRCILILTPNFLQNNKWGKREYRLIFTRELIEEKRKSHNLPVWHQVTAKDVYAYSPILADRLGARWEDGVEEVSRKLLEAIDAPNF